MKCSKATRMLQFYIDQRLSQGQIRTLETHIYDCRSCREELFFLEEVHRSLHSMQLVAEPADLEAKIMRRVASSPRQVAQKTREQRPYMLFRPSISEILAAILLATIAMVGIALEQPAVRAVVLPTMNGHDSLSVFFSTVWSSLGSTNSGTLLLGLWIIGTLLGVWITLMVAGSDMRNTWYRAVVNRLPVW
ncbi:MAG: hypothetical protein H0U76_27080 [Ktedonobacteraceae bacterium]|nr:hypothetical protein [Ktedonobacteraceae bacterium]